MRCSKPGRSAGYDEGPRRNCGPEKSQGIVTLHSDAVTEVREGRASETLDESTIKKDDRRTSLRMQDSICEACPERRGQHFFGENAMHAGRLKYMELHELTWIRVTPHCFDQRGCADLRRYDVLAVGLTWSDASFARNLL